jgi:hypothetical protein
MYEFILYQKFCLLRLQLRQREGERESDSEISIKLNRFPLLCGGVTCILKLRGL